MSKNYCTFAAKFRTSMEKMKQELREIVNTPARKVTKEQRERVREIATELGVAIPEKTRCNSCWLDTALMCYNELENRTATTGTSTEGRKYVLKPNVDLLFGGIRINAATLTDELAEYIIKRGFETKYFEKCK